MYAHIHRWKQITGSCRITLHQILVSEPGSVEIEDCFGKLNFKFSRCIIARKGVDEDDD